MNGARCSRGAEKGMKKQFSDLSAVVWLCTHKRKNVGQETANWHLSASMCNGVAAEEVPFVCQRNPEPTSRGNGRKRRSLCIACIYIKKFHFFYSFLGNTWRG